MVDKQHPAEATRQASPALSSTWAAVSLQQQTFVIKHCLQHTSNCQAGLAPGQPCACYQRAVAAYLSDKRGRSCLPQGAQLSQGVLLPHLSLGAARALRYAIL